MTSSPIIKVASYNVRKAVGTDRRRDPARVLRVLAEIDADVVALQEADKRVGTRGAAVPHALIDDHGLYRACNFNVTHTDRLAKAHGNLMDRLPDHPLTAPLKKLDFRNLGWHGNAILVRRDLEIAECLALDMPTIEPRGAACAVLASAGRRFRVIGTHLDLSGLRRRDQVRSLLRFASHHGDMPTVILGDFNQWGHATGAMREFAGDWGQIAPGPSYPSRAPVARLDRIVHCGGWDCHQAAVHHSALASVASDHLPIHADLSIA